MEVGVNSNARGGALRPAARGVRQADVDKAADAILARGERPTVERIRGLLGTGSPNTLGPLIDNWYRHLSALVAGTQHAAAPGGAPTAAVNAFHLMWDTALEEARRAVHAELATVREQLVRERAAVAEDQRVIDATRAALEQAAQASRERIRDLEEQLVASAQQLHREQQAVAAGIERAAALQQELAQSRREMQERSDVQQEERRREAERTAANERRLLAEVDRARGETKAAQDELRRALAQGGGELLGAGAARA